MVTVSRSKAVVALAAAAIVGLAVLGGGAGPSVHADSVTVTIVDFQFKPDPVTVSAGSSITWTNQDSTTHTVVSDSNAWVGPTISPGGLGTVTLNVPGTYRYICTIHPQMRGTVIVTAASVAAPAQVSVSATPGLVTATASLTATAAPPSAATPPPSTSPAIAGTARVKAGTNLIGVPAGTIVTATAIFAYNPDTNDYRQLAPGEVTRAGAGYWAMFDADGSIPLTAGSSAPVSIAAAANRWQLVGNPSGGQPALVGGADAVYTYDTGTGQYTAATVLQPGQGAWAISVRGGTITITPGGTAAAATATASPTVAATAQPVRTASPAAAQPTASPYVPPY